MAENKKGFILYADMIHMVNKMAKTDEGKKKIADLFITILEYVNDRNPVPEDPMVEIIFEPIKQQLKRDLKSYEKTIESKKESGAIGNLKRWHKDLHQAVLDGKMSLQEAIFKADELKAAPNQTVRKTSHSDKTVTVRVAPVTEGVAPVTVRVAKIADTDNDNVNDTVKDISLKETFFNDLPGSRVFEDISRELKIPTTELKTYIPGFRTTCSAEYKTFSDFATHFKRTVNRIRLDKSQEITAPQNKSISSQLNKR